MKTLPDVIAAIRAAELPVRKREEMISACNTAARALAKPPDRIPAEPARLMAQLHKVPSPPIGVSRRRWANVMSHLRAALALVSPLAPCRRRQPLSEAWQPLYRQLDRWGKLKLSRCLRCWSAQGIEPDMVTEASFDAYRQHIDAQLLAHPERILAAAIDGWRQAQAAVQGWPRVKIVRPSRRRDWTRSWEELPPSLRQDYDAWCARLIDPIAEVPLRPVRPRTIAARDWQLRAFATALILRGREPPASLRDLVEIETFKEGLRHLVDRYGGEPTKTVYGVAVMLKGLARHHLGMDQPHLDRMAAIIRRVQVSSNGPTEKNIALLRQFLDLRKQDALLGLPDTLMESAARNPKLHKGAIEAQTAVAIEVLLGAPMRISNLAALDLERHFVHLDNRQAMRIVLSAEEVKNREPADYPMSSEKAELIQRYLTEFRPRLGPADCTALFPGRNGGAKSINSLRDQISGAIRRHVDARMHPHLFRHFAGLIWLQAHPGDYETVRRFLGHRSINTTIKFYAAFDMAAAVSRFDEVIRDLRKKAKADEREPAPRP